MQICSSDVCQNIMKLKTSKNEEIKIALFLAFHCAPILKGIKAANIITVTMREFFKIGYLLSGTAISYRFLKIRENKGILYLYRKKEITQYLYSDEIQAFLKDYGYKNDNLEQMLDCLSEKISMYSNGIAAFPHEIGVFLEYPLLDVKGFLENNGENFAFSGYWKVYHDVQGAVRRFRQYDEERAHAIEAVAAGKTIREIII